MMLVDSTLYIAWLRARQDPQRLLEPWLRASQVCCCGIVQVEVLRGIVDARVKDRMSSLFDLLIDIPMGPIQWKEAADLAWTLDRKGTVLPLTDIVIAACARSRKAVLLTTDRHFKSLSGLTVRSSLPEIQ